MVMGSIKYNGTTNSWIVKVFIDQEAKHTVCKSLDEAVMAYKHIVNDNISPRYHSLWGLPEKEE